MKSRLMHLILPPSLLLILNAIFFRSALFGKKILCSGDLFFVHYPQQYYWVSQLFAGTAPFLNAALNGGQPLLANPGYAVFYPGNILFFLLPFNTAWNWILILHVFWAALGTFYLARSFHGGRTISFAAAILFAFSHSFVSSISHYNLIFAASWLPWILFFAGKAIVSGGRWIAIASLALTAQILAGSYSFELLAIVLLIVYCGFLTFRSKDRKTCLIRGASVFGIAILIASIQLVPALLWLPQTEHYSMMLNLDQNLILLVWFFLALGIAMLVNRIHGNALRNFANFFIALLILVNAIFFTHRIPEYQTAQLFDSIPYLLSWFPQTRDFPILHRGPEEMNSYFRGDVAPHTYFKEALHPLVGFRWGIRYACATTDGTDWKVSVAREKLILSSFPGNEAIAAMRESGIGRVISLIGFNRPHLSLDHFVQFKGDKYVWVYTLNPSALPAVRWQDGSTIMEWRELASHSIQLVAQTGQTRTALVVRNAIPGWTCKIDGKRTRTRVSKDGWLLFDVPPGKHSILLQYRPPGLMAAAVLSSLGSLLVLSLLLLA